MKKSGLLFAISFCVLNAAVSQEIPVAARAAYAAGNYKQAAELYASIPQKSPAVWYALGCCAYKSGSYAYACAMWQRACVLGGDADIRQRCERNQRCAQEKLGLTVKEHHWWQSLDEWYARVPLFCVQLLFFCYWIVLLVFVYRRWQIKKIGKILGAALVGSLIVFSGALIYRYQQDSRTYAVVVREEQVLYAGPGSDYPIRVRVACGQTLSVRDRRGEWYKVSSADGIVGWITRSSLMMVRP